MARFRWHGTDDILTQAARMQHEMDRFLSSLRPGPGSLWSTQRADVYPAINVYKDAEGFIVRAEIPGTDPTSVDLEISGDTLTLRGERRPPEVPDGAAFHRREREFGRFRRSLTLPEPVDSGKATASFNNGVLEVFLPHAVQAQHRRIEVKAE